MPLTDSKLGHVNGKSWKLLLTLGPRACFCLSSLDMRVLGLTWSFKNRRLSVSSVLTLKDTRVGQGLRYPWLQVAEGETGMGRIKARHHSWFRFYIVCDFFFPFQNWVVAVPVTVLNKVTAVFSLLPHIHTELWFLFIPYLKKIFLNTIQVKYFLILKASGFTKWVSVSFASKSSLNLSIINLNRKHLPYYLSHLGIFKCCLIGPEELHLDLALDTTFSVISCYSLW